MYLKAIEIQGFKSFAGKTRFDFHDGITCIVGPNGSGKSNVSDAVRWVLGEQSAKTLRGANMQDVIFAGTADKKAQSYAYVAIILDNLDRTLKLDFDEVIVARRVYRSGDSEYLINNSSCRLKDVQELFYDTGIGKEGYSIIGQGQIDRILSEKPEDRRELFDEAAGIVKFKKNKSLALKKLENETQNLDRVQDIISEIENRVPNLEKESKKAREFLTLRDKLKEKEVDFFHISYKEHNLKKEKLNEKLEITRQNLLNCEQKLNKVKEEYSLNQKNTDIIDRKLSDLSIIANDKEIEKKQYESQIELVKEQINTLKEKKEEYINRLKEQELIISEKTDEKLQLNDKQKDLENEKEILLKEVEKESEEFESLKNKLNDINSENIEKSNMIFKTSGIINSAKALLLKNKELLGEINADIELLEEKKNRFISENDLNLDKLNENNENIKNLFIKIESENKKLSNIDKELNQINDEYIILKNDIKDIMLNIEKAESKKQIFSNMLNTYEGYSFAIKKIMDQKKDNDSIIGVVGDIIEVDKKYQKAIEIALGSKIQNIIVKEGNAAKELINYLKNNKYGRATFLPLNMIKNKKDNFNFDILSEKGVIGWANTLVKVDKIFENAILYLLSGNLVLDNIDNAMLIAKKYNQSIKMVTLQGDVFLPGGSMTGGDYKKNYNFLGRKNEIEELQNFILEQNEILKNKRSENDELSLRKNELNDAKNISTDNLQDLKIKINSLKIIEEQIKNGLNTIKNTIDEINCEIKNKNNKLNQIYEQINISDSEIKEQKDIMEDLNANRANMQQIEDDIKRQVFELGRNLEEKKIKYAKTEQTCTYNDETILKIEDEIEKAKISSKTMLDRSMAASEAIKNKNIEIEDIKQNIIDTNNKHNEILNEITQKNQDKANFINNSKELFKNLDEVKNENQLLNDEFNRLDNAILKDDEIYENLLDYMWNEYEMSFSDLEEIKEIKNDNLTILKKEIKELKEDIHKFGVVNIVAISEFSELSKRLNFLNEQKNDIEESKKALFDLIKELDIGMSEQFNDRFKKIQEYFEKVFKELFGGGSASLKMTNADDVLNTGISINVQPPGKKLQNMMVLSGGEKAMTAISLLFAIQNLRPSPFCLLDEIEAALDDSNVDRFAGYLKKLDCNTQFIIITHRKGTMAVSDRLYGITMQEKGVSALVSVNLVEKELI